MSSPSASQSIAPELLEAERLFQVALQKDQEARQALEAAEAAFRRIGRPMPLFDRLVAEAEGRG
jgi:hypothetical protein